MDDETKERLWDQISRWGDLRRSRDIIKRQSQYLETTVESYLHTMRVLSWKDRVAFALEYPDAPRDDLVVGLDGEILGRCRE